MYVCVCIYVILMNFVCNKINFQTNVSLHSINTRTNSIFMEQVPTFHVFRKVHSVLASKFSAVYRVV